MKKTLFAECLAILSRKTRGLASAVLAATALVSALPLTLRADEAADRKTAADMNRHGFELFRLLSEKDAKENAFISPYSINSAFGLVYCGAKAQTAQEIRDTLGLPSDPADCGRFFDAVSKDYAAREKAEVLVSNSVWYEKKYDDLILPSFIDMIGKYYGGTFYKEDFSQRGALVKKVNAYVEEHTKDMIKDLLSPDDITPRSFMILLNTLYFEAKWKTPFKKDDTRPMIFRNFDGREKRVRMMYRRGFDIGYYANDEDNVHAVVLPYEDTRFDLIALMPIDPGTDRGEAAMKDIISKIGDRLDVWLKYRSTYETRLWLPVADLTCKYSLKEPLQELGMTTPFIDTKANFQGIALPSADLEQRLKYIWIEKVIHKTALKMDEVSTKAAAATAIIMGGMGGMANAQPPPVNIFRADRPYLVLIRDNQTGLILFAGRINDPGVEATAEDGPVAPSFEGRPFGMPFGMQPNVPGTSPRQTTNGANPAQPARTETVKTETAKPVASEPPVEQYTTDGKRHEPVKKLEPWIGGAVFLNPFLMPDFFGALTRDWRSIVLDAVVGKESDAVFWFTRDRVVYLNMRGEPPTSVQIDRKPWTDLKKPFVLDFVPDFASALDSENDSIDGDSTLLRSIRPGPTGVILRVGNARKTAAPVQYKMSMRVNKTLTNQLEELRETDPIASKDAMEAFKKKVGNGGDAVITIDGNLHKSAVFLMKGSLIVYKDGAWEGMYPVGVTVNGKPWKNLEEPFELDFVPDFSTASAYSYFSINDVERTFNVVTLRDRLALTVTNIGEPMTHFRHTIRLKKKPGAKPQKISQDDLDLMVDSPYSIDAADPFPKEGGGKQAQ